MKKYLISVFGILSVSILIISISMITVFANDPDNAAETKYLYDASEIGEVIKAVASDNAFSSSTADTDGKLNSNKEKTCPYKLYSVSPNDFGRLSAVKDAVNIVAKSGYKWIIPDNGRIIKAARKDGEWKVLGYSESEAGKEQAETVQSQSVKSILNTSQKTELSNKSNFNTVYICFEVPQYHTYFIGVFSENGNHVIPFGNRPDLTGLENGKEYSIEKANEVLTARFKIDSPTANDKNSGGNGQSEENNTLLIVLTVPTAILILSFLVIYFRKKRKI